MTFARACVVGFVASLVALGGCEKDWAVTVKTEEKLSSTDSRAPAPTPNAGLTGDVTLPRLVSRVEPRIPKRCRQAHVEGLFVYEATVTETGAVENLHTLETPRVSPPCPELEEESRKALSQSKYRPAERNGLPVRVVLTITQTIEVH
jgi:hypothetical protein